MNAVRDKFAGVVLGTAIGDALGYPVEFMDLTSILATYGPQGVVGPRGNPALYSDDTQMFRAVCEGLIRAGPDASLDEAAEEVAEEFIAWAFGPENTRAPGLSCMAGCRSLKAGTPWRLAGVQDGKGCGSAMRSMAYGLWFWDDPVRAAEWAAQHARMTHRSAEALAAAAAVAAGVAVGVQSSSHRAVADAMIAASRQHDLRTSHMLDRAVADAAVGVTTKAVLARWPGWTAAEAVASSLFCVLTHPRYRDAVLCAVNGPGDSDSLGAITGALSGAIHGAAEIPDDWVRRVERSKELITLAVRLWWQHRPGQTQGLDRLSR